MVGLWINNHIYVRQQDVITHPCFIFNSNLVEVIQTQSTTRVPLVDLACWWPLTWPNHPFSLSGNSCVPPRWNVILMLQKDKRLSLSDLSSKFIRFYLFIYATDSKLSSKISLLKKPAYVRNSLQIDLTMAQTFCLEIDHSNHDSKSSPRNNVSCGDNCAARNLFCLTGLDTYFFPSLAVGQPSNYMDLSKIEIHLGIMIVLSFFRIFYENITNRRELWSPTCLIFLSGWLCLKHIVT